MTKEEMRICDCADEDLQKILDDRRARREEERKKKLELRVARLAVALKAAPTLVDVLAPEHGRTTCNDQIPINGTADGRAPRCTRCWLLLAKNGQVGFDVSFDFYVNVPKL